jgi:hypothetical protein
MRNLRADDSRMAGIALENCILWCVRIRNTCDFKHRNLRRNLANRANVATMHAAGGTGLSSAPGKNFGAQATQKKTKPGRLLGKKAP